MEKKNFTNFFVTYCRDDLIEMSNISLENNYARIKSVISNSNTTTNRYWFDSNCLFNMLYDECSLKNDDIIELEHLHFYDEFNGILYYGYFIYKDNELFFNTTKEFRESIKKMAHEDLGTFKIYFYLSEKNIPDVLIRILFNFLDFKNDNFLFERAIKKIQKN